MLLLLSLLLLLLLPLPNLSSINFRRLKKEPLHVARIPGPTTDRIAALAITHQQYILIGSLLEESDDPKKAYNTSVLINPMGDIQAIYRKIHLFDAHIGGVRLFESDYFIKGVLLAIRYRSRRWMKVLQT